MSRILAVSLHARAFFQVIWTGSRLNRKRWKGSRIRIVGSDVTGFKP